MKNAYVWAAAAKSSTACYAGFAHQNRGLAICGLGIQLAGVALMIAEMFASWRARRAGLPLR